MKENDMLLKKVFNLTDDELNKICYDCTIVNKILKTPGLEFIKATSRGYCKATEHSLYVYGNYYAYDREYKYKDYKVTYSYDYMEGAGSDWYVTIEKYNTTK